MFLTDEQKARQSAAIDKILAENAGGRFPVADPPNRNEDLESDFVFYLKNGGESEGAFKGFLPKAARRAK